MSRSIWSLCRWVALLLLEEEEDEGLEELVLLGDDPSLMGMEMGMGIKGGG